MARKRNLLGCKFGRLTVIAESLKTRGENGQSVVNWLCECECGKKVVVRRSNLVSENTQSCGCYRLQRIKEAKITHGAQVIGEEKPEYEIWSAMIKRCENQNSAGFRHYGGRGIKICERWRHSFQNFIDDMGERPSSSYSIDRINNDGDYEPSNCRWASPVEQANNRRNNRTFNINGRKTTLSQLYRDTANPAVSYNTYRNRVSNYKWDPLEALTLTPLRGYSRKSMPAKPL